MTDEERIFVRLKCTVAYNEEGTRRFYWRDPVGDHSINEILMIEMFTMDNKWVVKYEAETLV